MPIYRIGPNAYSIRIFHPGQSSGTLGGIQNTAGVSHGLVGQKQIEKGGLEVDQKSRLLNFGDMAELVSPTPELLSLPGVQLHSIVQKVPDSIVGY